VSGFGPLLLSMIVPYFKATWFVLYSLDSKEKSWYSWLVFNARLSSFIIEKWIVFISEVEGSVPELDAAINSALLNPVYIFEADGVEMDLSFMVLRAPWLCLCRTDLFQNAIASNLKVAYQ